MDSIASPSISPDEAAFFGTLAADWWNPRGSSAMLHKVGPVRTRLIRDAVADRFGRDRRSRRPLDGLKVLDIGCGAGLLTEPLARMGAAVTGIDAAMENIAAAQVHAMAGGLTIDYRATSVEALAAGGNRYDVITCMEVVEHVADRDSFFAALAVLLAPRGVVVLSTPNRTPASWAVLIAGAEIITRSIPRGAHDWNRFMKPDELAEALAAAGLRVTATTGLTWRPGKGFTLGRDTSVDYFVTAAPA